MNQNSNRPLAPDTKKNVSFKEQSDVDFCLFLAGALFHTQTCLGCTIYTVTLCVFFSAEIAHVNLIQIIKGGAVCHSHACFSGLAIKYKKIGLSDQRPLVSLA